VRARLQWFTCGLAICAVVGVSACSTSPAPIASRRAVPADRIFAPTLVARSGERTASFTLTRAKGLLGVGVGIDVFVDGQRIARLAARETITIYVSPGQHILDARFSHGLVPPTEREFIAAADRSIRIRVTTQADSSDLDLKPESGALY
jgi:hypothetical protein